MEFHSQGSSNDMDTLFSVIRGMNRTLLEQQPDSTAVDFNDLRPTSAEFLDQGIAGDYFSPSNAATSSKSILDSIASLASTSGDESYLLSTLSSASPGGAPTQVQLSDFGGGMGVASVGPYPECWSHFSDSPSTSESRSHKRPAAEIVSQEYRDAKACKILPGTSPIFSDPSSVLCTIESSSGSPSANSSLPHLSDMASNNSYPPLEELSSTLSMPSSLAQLPHNPSTSQQEFFLAPLKCDVSNSSNFFFSHDFSDPVSQLDTNKGELNSQNLFENFNPHLLSLDQLKGISSLLCRDNIPTGTSAPPLPCASLGNMNPVSIPSQSLSTLPPGLLPSTSPSPLSPPNPGSNLSPGSSRMHAGGNMQRGFKIPPQKSSRSDKTHELKVEAKLEIASNWAPTSSVIVLKQPSPSSISPPSLGSSTIEDISRSAIALLLESSRVDQGNFVPLSSGARVPTFSHRTTNVFQNGGG